MRLSAADSGPDQALPPATMSVCANCSRSSSALRYWATGPARFCPAISISFPEGADGWSPRERSLAGNSKKNLSRQPPRLACPLHCSVHHMAFQLQSRFPEPTTISVDEMYLAGPLPRSGRGLFRPSIPKLTAPSPGEIPPAPRTPPVRVPR